MEKLRKVINVCVIGTSNSILKDGYTFAIKNDSRVRIFVNYSIGKSISLLHTVMAPDVDLAAFDVCILDFVVNEEVFCAWGLKTDKISMFLRGLVGRILSAGCLPVLLLLPRKGVRTDTSRVRGLYLELANDLNLPYFDAIRFVDAIEAHGKFTRDQMFYDDGHLAPSFAFEVGNHLLESILSMPQLEHEEHAWSYLNYRALSLPLFISEAGKTVLRKSGLAEMAFASLRPGTRVNVKIASSERIVGIYTNLARCGGHLQISGLSTEIIDLRNDYSSGRSDFVLSALAIQNEITPRDSSVSIEVIPKDEASQKNGGFIQHMLREAIRLPDIESVEIGGLILEDSRAAVLGARPRRSLHISLEADAISAI